MTGRAGRFDAVYRAEFGRSVAVLARETGDLGIAEDAVQEAFARALRRWPEHGVPDRPGAWITTVARRIALDRLRREAVREGKEKEAVLLATAATPEPSPDAVPAPGPLADDRLRLLFTCAHPALAPEARVALTLRLVCGLRTAEIARAFVVPEPTVAQRISRAKAKIRRARIPLDLPPEHRIPDRVPAVLAVIYLVFSEGYFATAGAETVRDDLCAEAIRLGELLCTLPGPHAAEAHALAALMLLQDSRRAARRTPTGALIPLEHQDRSHWDTARITAGLRHLRSAAGATGPYLPQAEIAATHATAPSWPRTDWARIATCYDTLTAAGAAAPVLVNRAIAIGFRDGPAAGLRELDAIATHPRLTGTHLLHAAYADAYRRAARHREAAAHYRAAIPTAGTEPVRAFLRSRLAEVEALTATRCPAAPPADSACAG